MCLAVPVKVIEVIDSENAVIDLSGTKKTVNVELIEDVKVGDYVILHVGYALQKVDPDQAQKTLAMFRENPTLAS